MQSLCIRPMSHAKCQRLYLEVCVIHKIYKTKILPVVLYGCDTWSLALKEEGEGTEGV
jgi:hypothetical protein